MMNKISVKLAELADIPGILNVLQQNLFRNKTESDTLSHDGFLIHGFTAEELQHSINRDDHIILVAKQETEVLGYAIEYQFQQNLPDSLTNLSIPTETEQLLASEKILYHRHIAKLSHAKNVGDALMQAVIQQAEERDCDYILCRIAQAPIKNVRSAAFHERFGFKVIGMDAADGLTYDLYLLARNLHNFR